MPKKKSRGGPREGSGRKPIKDKVVPVTFYVKKSVVKKLGMKLLKREAAILAQQIYETKL